jgi:hypothetical protein
MTYVQVLPYSFEGFLTIFDLVADNGDIYYHVESYEEEEPVTLREICRTFETSGWGLFSFAHAMPKLLDKLKFDVVEEDGEKFTAMRLAPFLGLPGNEDFKAELDELKELLTWLKDKGLETPTNQLRMILDSFGERETTFELMGKNKELTAKIQEEMFEKINQSPILTQWLENQKEGIVNTKGELHDLLASFPTVELMNPEEQDKYLAAQPPIKNLQKKINRAIRRGKA